MSSCPDLVTKEEFNKLKLLVKTIIDKASVLAVPLAVAATSKKLVPRINSAAEKAAQAFTTASSNAGKILGNAGKIAANAANIFGLDQFSKVIRDKGIVGERGKGKG